VRLAVERTCGEFDKLTRGKGCAKCRNSGFTGRIGIHELLVPDEAMREKITAAPNVAELGEMARAAGMVTLRQDGMAKVKAGITTIEEVFRATAL
jgi:type II secretory ATPase GspE/PulE/Tfp pilus assembly ATPase PilB-like protein